MAAAATMGETLPARIAPGAGNPMPDPALLPTTRCAAWLAVPFVVGACGGPAAAPANDAFWAAMTVADESAAHAAARCPDERRVAAVFGQLARGGSAAAFDQLVAIGGDAEDGKARAWAIQCLLDVLRLEGRWDRLATLRADHPRLGLGVNAIPAVLTRLQPLTIEVAEAPAVLPFAEDVKGWAAVQVHATGDAAAADITAILDTGAGMCVVDDVHAARLGVRPVEGELTLLGIAGGRSASRVGVLRELRFGGVTARDVPVAIVDEAELRDLSGVSCLVGWEVLQHVALEFVGTARQLVVRRSAGAAAMSAPAPNLLLLHEPVVRLLSGEQSLLLLLDSGAAATEFRLPSAVRMGWPTKEGGTAVSGLGGGGAGEVRTITSCPIQCGNVRLDLGGALAVERLGLREKLLRIDGTLGIDMAFAVRIVIDGPARTVVFRTD